MSTAKRSVNSERLSVRACPGAGGDGVDFEREAVKKAGKKASGGVGPPIRQDLEIDKAGGGRSPRKRSCGGGRAAAGS